VTVLVNLASGGAPRRILCLSRSDFEGGGMGSSCLVVVRTSARGLGWQKAGGRTVAGVAAFRRPTPHSARDGAAVPGMAAQRRGWPHRAEVMEKTRPAGLTSRHRPARARNRHPYLFRGFRRPPSRGATWGRTRVGGTVSRSWHRPCRTAPAQGELVEQRRDVIPRRC
jgi:hypothetical protein